MLPLSGDIASVSPPQLPSRLIVQLQGRPLRDSDIGPSLEGQRAEMFWPDDNLWYLVEINSVDMRSHQARRLCTWQQHS